MNRKYFAAFRVIATIAILVALFKFVPYDQLIKIWRDSRKGYIAVCLIVFLTNYFIGEFLSFFLRFKGPDYGYIRTLNSRQLVKASAFI